MKKASISLIFIFTLAIRPPLQRYEEGLSPWINVVCSQDIKMAEFAGSFYPKDKEILNSKIDRFLKDVKIPSSNEQILGVISPHAGYIYSGPVAACSFKILEDKKFDTVVLLGPTHRYHFDGISIYPSGSFDTPLGGLEVDSQLAEGFKSLEFAIFEPKYFYGEHCIEVELPFVIKTLGKVKILPILFGKVDYEQMKQLAEKLSQVSSSRNILLVISTDLSHYQTYAKAVEIDKDTTKFIKKKDAHSLWFSRQFGGGRACGISPLVTFLIYAQIKEGDIKILKYANSGDMAGDKMKVVGYLSAAAYKKVTSHQSPVTSNKEGKMEEYSLNDEEKKHLLNIARSTLESYLKEKKVSKITVESKNLKEKRGAFVTLKKKGQLRGCVGRIVADIPLYEVISKVAIDSALNDSRFPPVNYEELEDIEIEISVLTPFVKVENLEEIEVGKHGLMIKKGFYSGLLLPQVPLEWGWDKKTFLEHTCMKANLPANAYKDKSIIIYRFSAIVFNESD